LTIFRAHRSVRCGSQSPRGETYVQSRRARPFLRRGPRVQGTGLRDLDALVALQKDTPEAAAARTAAAGRVIDKIEAERGAPVATLADRDFTEDQRLAVLRLLGGMPYSGNLFGVHNVRNLDDLLSWLRNYQRMLVEHSKDDDNREAEHRELVAMVNGARRWHALTTMPPGSPIGGAW
jgi:hypothetical protein